MGRRFESYPLHKNRSRLVKTAQLIKGTRQILALKKISKRPDKGNVYKVAFDVKTPNDTGSPLFSTFKTAYSSKNSI